MLDPNNSPEYSDAPIPLLAFCQASGQFEIQQGGLEFFRTLPAPIAVLGVAGMYRTGKSYLLNRVLLDRNDGFGVGPTVNPCTKGLWVWGRPLLGTALDGSPCNVVVVDSEGIGALDEDVDHDTRIFALVVLLSSVFLYNSVGTIDESALQNLSLVVNVTKLVQVKSGNVGAAEDFSQYFPSFNWVLRDFALQLKDAAGATISANEYLERALQPQKGSSESTEEKNRIRRHLKECFQERACFTLVRPVTQETELQELEGKTMGELRVEFAEQVYELRRKTIQRARVKSIHGKQLTGNMIATMIESYVTALNRGAAPNIETTWTYICRNECGKAAREAEDLYERTLITHNLPVNPLELKRLHREARDCALALFHSKAVGDSKEQWCRDLSERITEKFSALKHENETESQRKSTAFLNENYSGVENKLRRGDFPTYFDFEQEMRNFQKFFSEHGPDGPQRGEIILEFIQVKLHSAAEHFLRAATGQLDVSAAIHKDKLARHETELRELREDSSRETQELHRKLALAETEKTQAAAQEAALLQQLGNSRAAQENAEDSLREALKSSKEQAVSLKDAATSQSQEFEVKMKELRREGSQRDSEHKQVVDLLSQKQNHLETSLEETRKKEKEHIGALRAQKKEHSAIVKDLYARYESQLKNLQTRLDSEIDRTQELERELDHKDTLLERDKGGWEDSSSKLKSSIEDLRTQLETAQEQLERSGTEGKRKLADLSRGSQQQLAQLSAKTMKAEEKLALKEEALKTLTQTSSRELAVLKQRLEFLELESAGLKQQLDDERNSHSNMLRTLQAANSDSAREEVEIQLQKLRAQYIADINQQENEAEEQRKKTNSLAESLKQQLTELEIKYRVDTNHLGQQLRVVEEGLSLAAEDKDKLQTQVNLLQFEASQFTRETELKANFNIKSLEGQLEESGRKQQAELAEIRGKAEATYTQLKDFYQQEKERVEQKLAEDKERSERKYNAVCEDYEERLRQEAETYEDELASKEEELRQLDSTFTEELAHHKHRTGLDAQQIETLEKHLKDTKRQQESEATAHAAALDQHQQRSNTERAQLNVKIDKLTMSLSETERELSSASYQKAQISSSLSSKETELEDLKTQFLKEKTVLTERFETAKENYQQVSDEYTQKRSDFKRENALLQQEVEFKAKRSTELEDALCETEAKHSEALKSLKEQFNQELAECTGKLTQDKESLEQKLLQKRKALRELSSSTLRQISGLEKERAVLTEKLTHLDSKKNELEQRLCQEVESLHKQLSESADKEDSGELSLHLENERLRTLEEEKDKELTEQDAAFERERLLWEGKFSFLVQQRDQIREDYSDAQRKFEATLGQLQKRGASDKEKLSEATHSLVASIETRCKSQLKELQDAHAAVTEELNSKNSALDKELRTYREQLEIERRGHTADSGSLDKKLKGLEDSENRLISEIDLIKRDRDAKLEEIKESLMYEKDMLKAKWLEAEKRAKDAENARSYHFLESEKERAKWNLEKDHLTAQKQDALDALERAQKKKETLFRELEKLRSDRGGKRNAAGLFARKPENSQQFRQGMGGLLNRSGMSFEEFAKRTDDAHAETSSTATSPYIPRRAVSPLSLRSSRSRRASGAGILTPKDSV